MSERFLFPQWVDRLKPPVLGALLIAPVYLTGLVWFGFSPKTTDVGYAPVQPVPYSHALHVGKLGLDCRYCHTTVDKAAFAAIPPTQTCMNCHEQVLPESPRLAPVRESYATGEPIPWIKVHDLPDYVYFDHSAHVTRGVSCVECHGRVDQMEVVTQVEPLSMSWCLECHRSPHENLRPSELVTDLAWEAEDPAAVGMHQAELWNITPGGRLTDCSTCHR